MVFSNSCHVAGYNFPLLGKFNWEGVIVQLGFGDCRANRKPPRRRKSVTCSNLQFWSVNFITGGCRYYVLGVFRDHRVFSGITEEVPESQDVRWSFSFVLSSCPRLPERNFVGLSWFCENAGFPTNLKSWIYFTFRRRVYSLIGVH